MVDTHFLSRVCKSSICTMGKLSLHCRCMSAKSPTKASHAEHHNTSSRLFSIGRCHLHGAEPLTRTCHQRLPPTLKHHQRITGKKKNLSEPECDCRFLFAGPPAEIFKPKLFDTALRQTISLDATLKETVLTRHLGETLSPTVLRRTFPLETTLEETALGLSQLRWDCPFRFQIARVEIMLRNLFRLKPHVSDTDLRLFSC